jgi:alanine dehydrogenase
MTLFLDEACVAGLVGMDDALGAVEEVFAAAGRGAVTNVPRLRVPLTEGTLRITAAVANYRGYYGVKVSSTTIFESGAGRVFSLYKEETGELCAIVQVFSMGALRTGAASGVATRHLAKPDASVLAVIGAGRQAETQLQAVCAVRPIREIRVHSRDAGRRAAFCAPLAERGYDARPCATAEEAVRGADVIVTATTAEAPVVRGEWIAPGAHINAIGANFEHRRELDSAAVARCAVICTDDVEQVRYEATDLAAPVAEGLIGWDAVHPLGGIVAGAIPGRQSADDITMFKSLGVAMEDVALAARAYEKAVTTGAGVKLPDLAG